MTGKQAEKVAAAIILSSDSEEECREMLISWAGADATDIIDRTMKDYELIQRYLKGNSNEIKH